MNEVCSCIPVPSNTYLRKTIVFKMKNTNCKQDVATVGLMPDSLAGDLYKPLLEK